MLEELLIVMLYSVIGIILMMVGTEFIDLIIPCEFSEEITKGNTAVSHVMMGSNIAIALIIRAAIMSPSFTQLEQEILAGLASTFIYFVVGLVMLVVGYYAIALFNRKYKLSEEISEGNTAAGQVVMGLFIGIAIVVSGVIM